MKFVIFTTAGALGYCLAAMFSSRVSMDPAQTDWDSMWTYIWWMAAFLVAMFAVALALAMILRVLEKFS